MPVAVPLGSCNDFTMVLPSVIVVIVRFNRSTPHRIASKRGNQLQIRWPDALPFHKSALAPMNTTELTSPRSALWALRVLVVVLAASMAVAITNAAHSRSSAAAPVATVAWGALTVVLVIAVVVPGPLALTVVRLLTPATVPAAATALALGSGAGWGVLTLVVAVLTCLVGLSAEAAEALVQGSAYGREQRLPLRTPAAMLLPIVMVWSVWCAVLLSAILELGAGHWLVGVVMAVLSGALGWLLATRLHRYSCRWLVVVPAGVVVHDAVVLAETLMVQRGNVAIAQLAPANTEAADLTGPAAGHALEIVVREMELIVLAVSAREPKGKALHVQSILVAPSRPGRALTALGANKIPVG